jgi:hypothetical protein
MDPIKNEPPTKAAQAKNRQIAFIVGGMGDFGNSSPHSLSSIQQLPGSSAGQLR